MTEGRASLPAPGARLECATPGCNAYTIPTASTEARLGLQTMGTFAVFDPDAGDARPGDIVAIWWKPPVARLVAQPTIVRVYSPKPGWAPPWREPSIVYESDDGRMRAMFLFRIERVDRLVAVRP